MRYLGILLGILLLLLPGMALAADVGGTEYCPSTNGTIYAHVLYLNGTPANGSTVTLTLWASDGTKVLDAVGMTHIAGSNGGYQYNFTTPATEGVYFIDVVTSNPTGYGSGEVHVTSYSCVNATIGNATYNITANVTEIWSENITGYTDPDTFGGVLNEFLGGGSMLLVGLILLCTALMGFAYWKKVQMIMWVAVVAWVGFTFWQRSLTPGWGTFDIHEILFYVGFLMVIICMVEAVMMYRATQPVKGKSVTVKMTSAEKHQQLMDSISNKARGYRRER